MESVDLTRPSELFVADDIIRTAQELQTHLSAVSYDEQPKMAADAMDVLGDPRELYGGKKVLVHALGARVLFAGPQAISFDEQLWHGTYFGDAYLKANFSRFSYIRSFGLAGLCLTLVETAVLKSHSNPEFEGETIKSGVYVPVHAVETVLAA